MDTFCSWPTSKPPLSPQSPPCLGFPRNLHLHYEFPQCDKLGKGGFGVVHLVQKRINGEKFACKEINKLLDASLASSEQQRRHIDNVLREVAVLKKLKGSLNVVNLEAVYEDEKSVYIITECCFGGELIHTIGIRPYSESTVRMGVMFREQAHLSFHCSQITVLSVADMSDEFCIFNIWRQLSGP